MYQAQGQQHGGLMDFLDRPSYLLCLPQALGSRMERRGGKAEAQAHQGCSPSWRRHHLGGRLGAPLSHLQPCRGHQASWSLPSCFHTDLLLTELPWILQEKGDASATRGQQDPLTHGQKPCPSTSKLHYFGYPP